MWHKNMVMIFLSCQNKEMIFLNLKISESIGHRMFSLKYVMHEDKTHIFCYLAKAVHVLIKKLSLYIREFVFKA
jgi:hypothetical protein